MVDKIVRFSHCGLWPFNDPVTAVLNESSLQIKAHQKSSNCIIYLQPLTFFSILPGTSSVDRSPTSMAKLSFQDETSAASVASSTAPIVVKTPKQRAKTETTATSSSLTTANKPLLRLDLTSTAPTTLPPPEEFGQELVTTTSAASGISPHRHTCGKNGIEEVRRWIKEALGRIY